jgi:hypothetical protein
MARVLLTLAMRRMEVRTVTERLLTPHLEKAKSPLGVTLRT